MLKQVFSFCIHQVLATKARVQFLDGSYDLCVTLGQIFLRVTYFVYVYHLSYLCSIPVLPKTFLLANPFWVRKIATDPHILTDANIVCRDGRYPKFKLISHN
jgi:hypothetical protein